MQFLRSVQAIDQWVLFKLYGQNFHPKINVVLRKYTRLGDGYFWFPVLAYLLYQYPIQESLYCIFETSVITVLSLVFYKFVKNKIKRPRPYNKYDHIVAQIEPMDSYSFPSGHTMNNLSAGIAIGLNFPELIPFTVLVPISWGLLRIYFGVHYLSDVIAGFLMALSVALVGHFIVQIFTTPLP